MHKGREKRARDGEMEKWGGGGGVKKPGGKSDEKITWGEAADGAAS